MSPRFMVALDLGKQTHVGYVYDTTQRQLSKPLRIKVEQADFLSFESQLRRYSNQPSDFLIGHEATGHYGETLLRRLRAAGYPIVELNGRQVAEFRRGLGRRAKTDKLDAEAMARQLATGEFQPTLPPSPTQQALQRMSRLREDLVKEQTRWLNRLRSLLDQTCPELSLILPDLTKATVLAVLQRFPSGQALAQASVDELTVVIHQASRGQKGQEFAQQLQTIAANTVGFSDPWLETEVQLVVSHLQGLGAHLRTIEAQIISLSQTFLAEISAHLGLSQALTNQDFPWDGPLALGTLLAEIGDIRRFASIKHLLSFLGWCPYSRDSGTKRPTGLKMSHQGNRFARRMLWMMAINVVQRVPEYQVYYQQRLQAGKNKMKSLVAVGRKLLSVIYAILKSGQPYDPQRYLQRQQASAKG
ncbi:MAG: IS110 family transposase [Anaerolineales bacterium]|nr:IS110 family transposase [Anaerolineales bacterium]MBE7556352.1 IS110 family transposase [Anaerolineales bacterium]